MYRRPQKKKKHRNCTVTCSIKEKALSYNGTQTIIGRAFLYGTGNRKIT